MDIALSPLPPVPGWGRLVQAVVRDTLPRWSVQQDLLVQSVAMDAAANGIVISGVTGVIEWVNPAVTRMTGYQSGELIGRHTRILKSDRHDSGFYRTLWQTVLAGQTWFGEIANRRKDGTICYEEQHIAPVMDDNGRLAHFIAIKQDVTARKQAETELHEANEELTRRLAEIGALHQQLREQSVRDPLTNLFNRRYLDETLKREVIRGQRDALDLALIVIDVDAFKRVNDTTGHAARNARRRCARRSPRPRPARCRRGSRDCGPAATRPTHCCAGRTRRSIGPSRRAATESWLSPRNRAAPAGQSAGRRAPVRGRVPWRTHRSAGRPAAP